VKGAYRLAQSRTLTMSLQRLHLNGETGGHCMSNKPHLLRWRYKTRPNALGREYEVLVSYKIGSSPDVFVIAPDLFSLTDERIPHLFYTTKDQEFRSAACLCLYMRKYGEWHAQKLIAATIVPWVDLWLLYFEYWLTTGNWEGGGEHPS
jgi:hypothetical protein